MKELTIKDLKKVKKAVWLNTFPGYYAHFARMRKRRFLPDVPEDEIRLAKPPLTLKLDIPQHKVVYIQPDRHFFTDYGSMPKIVQLMPGYDRRQYPFSYLLHDSCCRHHVVYLGGRVRYETNLQCVPVSRSVANYLLYLGLKAENCPSLRASIIYNFVRLFGPRW